jgi:hypothetical protein
VLGHIRNIKPDFFIDEQLAKLGPLCRLLFIGLWTHADRAGRLENRPDRLRAIILPHDKLPPGGVATLLGELAATPGRFVILYQAGGRSLIQIRTFSEHQRPNHREPVSRIPPPPVECGIETLPTVTVPGPLPVEVCPGTPGHAQRGGEGNGIGNGNGIGEGEGEGKGALARSPPELEAILAAFKAAWRRRYRAEYLESNDERSDLGRLLRRLPPDRIATLPACFERYLADEDTFVAQAKRHSLAWFFKEHGENKYLVEAKVLSPKEARGKTAAAQWLGGRNGERQ